MLRYRKSYLILPLLLLVSSSAWGQIRRAALGPSDYRRAGLEVAWTSQIELDQDRSAASNLHLQVVGLDSYEDYLATSYPVYEVKYDKGVRRFSAIDLGRSGKAIGDAEAARLAEKEKIRLEARGYTATIEERRVPRTVMYAQTNSGTVQAIDAENGRTLWAILVGHPNYQTLIPAANDQFVSVVNGSTLYLLERETGEQVWKRSLQNNPTVGPVLTRTMVFAPALNGQVEGHWLPSADDPIREPDQLPFRRPTWFYRSDSRVTAPITATPRTISWPTEGGRMYVADVEEPEMQYLLRTSGPIHGRTLFVEPDRLAVGSSDGYVYCVNEVDGAVHWEYATGEPIRESLFRDDERIYAVTELGNLHAISTTDGFQQWLATGVKRILAASEDRLYVMDTRGMMHGLDPKTGGRLMTLNTSGYDVPILNQKTDRIYLAASDGTITCLREIQAELPTIHISLPQPPSEAEETKRPTSEPTPTRNEFSPPADDDMFDDGSTEDPMPEDDPMDEDPFAPGDDDPFGGTEEDDEDPFGFDG